MNRSKHHLDPLLRPKSIAVVGASERPGSVGRQTMENLLTGRYPGKLYAVNPAYKSVCGVTCFPDLVSLPENVDHVVLTVGDTHIEAALDDVIAHGAKAATMMSSLVLAGDEESLLRERVAKKIASTGLIAAFRKANYKGVPVVALKVGRTELSARVGGKMTRVQPGDHVVMSYRSCGACRNCLAGEASGCEG